MLAEAFTGWTPRGTSLAKGDGGGLHCSTVILEWRTAADLNRARPLASKDRTTTGGWVGSVFGMQRDLTVFRVRSQYRSLVGLPYCIKTWTTVAAW